MIKSIEYKCFCRRECTLFTHFVKREAIYSCCICEKMYEKRLFNHEGTLIVIVFLYQLHRYLFYLIRKYIEMFFLLFKCLASRVTIWLLSIIITWKWQLFSYEHINLQMTNPKYNCCEIHTTLNSIERIEELSFECGLQMGSYFQIMCLLENKVFNL